VIVIPVVVGPPHPQLNQVPHSLREACVALGCTQWEMIKLVCYRAARSGIVTGILLAVARIAGETAPLLFTALNSQFMTWNMNGPMSNLPMMIFQYAGSPYPDWQRLAWAGATLITLLVLGINIVARIMFSKQST
jgi:phosphate transport system permease protein